jgi:ABC-type nickel/cobalt efflux system permease component RcnA
MLRLHLAVVVLVPSFVALGIWQLRRALSGNTLSWAYTFEWPLLAGYALYMWWRLVHEERESANTAGDRSQHVRAPESEADKQADEALKDYNRYLTELHASDKKNAVSKDRGARSQSSCESNEEQ